MKTTIWDKLQTSSPVNKQAAMETASHGSPTSSKIILSREWQELPPMRNPSWAERNHPHFVDLKGVKFGRFVVLGIAAGEHAKKQDWVCRCACGVYAARRAKSIRNPRNDGDRCEMCRQTEFLRREDSAEQRAKRKSQGLGY